MIQRLMTPLWLKQLNKAGDCLFTITPCHPFWPSDNCEPLIVALLFPYLPYRPYQLKGTPKMFYMGRKLSKVFQEPKMDGGNLLLKFLLEIGKFSTMQESVVWRMLYYGQTPPFSCGCAQVDGGNQDYGKRERRRKRKNTNIQPVGTKKTKST